MSWKIPLSDISFGPDEWNAVQRVLDSKWVSMGPETAAFEAEFAEYLGIKHAFAVSSGTAALHLALLATDIRPGDEVIVPSLTFVATVNAVKVVGAVPVFADVTDISDWNISAEKIERKITPRTKAVIAVHYGGFPCRMDLICHIARERGLIVVEDAAHAPGGVFREKKLGTWGNAGCFSFFANKNMTTGEGGMVVTDDDSTAERLKLLRSHGMTSLTWDRHNGHSFSYDVVASGFNYRIDEVRAAMGRVQLKKLEENNRKRREKTALLRTLLRREPCISFPFMDEMLPSSSCHIFPVLLERAQLRPSFMEFMKRAGIQTSVHYPPVHLFTAYRNGDEALRETLPITEDVASREVTLPLFPDILPAQMGVIAAELSKWCESQ